MNASSGATMFANRLRKRRKHLRNWLNKESISAYRVYDADIPEYALAVDVYTTTNNETHIVVYEYQAPKSIDPDKAITRLQEALSVILDEFTIPKERLYLKVRKKQKGLAQYEKEANKKFRHTVIESGNQFLVNFTDYLDTGLFLDHRATRKVIAENAHQTRFLNLFAYTGSATVYAAQGGALQTTTIDMSNTYLSWAKENMALNGYTQECHQYIQDDCIQWLARESEGKWHRYDLIFLDPPAFSTSKKMESNFDIQRDHATLIQQCMLLLKKDGILLFSNNNRQFKIDSSLEKSFDLINFSTQTIPKDFEKNKKIHNSWIISRKE